jgi:hypothetical protein
VWSSAVQQKLLAANPLSLLHAGGRADSIAAAACPFSTTATTHQEIRAMLLLMFSVVAVAATSAALFVYAWTVQAVARAPVREAERFSGEVGDS